MIGTTISHYKILEELGRGGMGVVYKAEDTKLDRLVALKFLPQHVQASDDEKARFLQEAKAAATLNHPNICIIHDIKEEEGKSFIVMELVDGMTLREKFHDAPIPMKEAVAYGIQIGEALEEAHSKHIVHRDIKADNIMVNAKNQIKVMDFGLAKLKGSLKLTKATSTVGTLGYMAPEQIQGGEADARSDIFSFGVVLFEMLTARLPFRGEHEAALMYSILNDEPDPLQKYVPEAPPELTHILTTALDKDANERYQTSAEMTRELRRLLKQSSRISRAPLSSANMRKPEPERAEPEARPGMMRLWWGLMIVGLVLVSAVIAYFFYPRTAQPESVSTGTLNPDMTFRVLPLPFTQFSYPGLSRDGNWITFPAPDANNRWDIYYMHVSGSNVRRLTNDSLFNGNNLSSDISPDGSEVAYSAIDSNGNSKVCIVSAVGGQSRTLVDHAILPRWRPDGQRIGYVFINPRGSKVSYGLWSIKPDGSDPKPEYLDSVGTGGRFSFNWSPDGKSLAWIRSFKDGYQEIFTHELGTDKELRLTNDKKNADDVAWTRNGFIVYSSNRGGNSNLWMVPVTGGPSQQVTKGSGPDIGISMSADDRKLVYLQQQRIGHIWCADLSTASARQVTFDDRLITAIAISPDKKRIALVMGDTDPLKPGQYLYIQDRDGGNRRQLTSDELVVSNLSWSPDGKYLAFAFTDRYLPPDSAKIYIIEPNSGGTPKYVSPGFRVMWLDDKSIVARNVKNSASVAEPFDELVTIENGTRKAFLGDSTLAMTLAAGNMLLYQDLHQQSRGVWMVPVDYIHNPSKYKPIRSPAHNGALDRSLKYAYYMNAKNQISSMDMTTGKEKRVSDSFPGLDANAIASVSDDDQELYYVTFQLSGKLVMIDNIFK